MDDGSTGLTDLRARLTSQPNDHAYVRSLLRRTGAAWTVHHLTALVGAEPPNWVEATWQYEQLAFVACNIPASTLAALCSNAASEAATTIRQFQVTAPAAQQFVQWTHQPSFARRERQPTPWPTTSYTISVADPTGRAVPPGFLVAESCPSFPDPDSAWRAFTENDYSLSGAQTTPTHLALVHIAEKQGRIGPIHISATEMTVEIDGDAVAGCELELYGESDRAAKRLDGPGVTTFTLSSGLPNHAWVWLKRGTMWLDYRSVFSQSGWTGDLAKAGVTIDMPIDPQANVEALVYAGENPQIEFKERLPDRKTRRTLKTVAAFANGDGGSIVFGINQDEATVVGLEGDLVQMRDRLINLIHATIFPMPQVVAGTYVVEGKNILVLEVEPGQIPPYGIVADGASRDTPEYYVRRGANTYYAQPGELREAILTRMNAQQSTTSDWRAR